MLTKIMAAAAVAAASLTGAASAATIVSGNVCEFAGNPSTIGSATCDFTFADFNGAVGDPHLTVAGDTTLFGYVAHGRANRWKDVWSMDFGTDTYEAVFNWSATSANADGAFTVSGNASEVFSTASGATSGTFTFSGLTGIVDFDLDPVAGVFGFSPAETLTWDLALTQIIEPSPVPVPAAGLMLVAALGGLGMVRRRKTA